jgi:hypothetical protein
VVQQLWEDKPIQIVAEPDKIGETEMKAISVFAAGAAIFLGGLSFAPDANAAAKKYPPHGYPCLGCHPCPPKPNFCDNHTNAKIVFSADGTPITAIEEESARSINESGVSVSHGPKKPKSK